MVAGIRPSLVSVSPNRASGTEIATSQTEIIPTPPPKALPCTRPIRGLGNVFSAFSIIASSRAPARRVSASDALFIAGVKGAMAGVVNTGLALALGAALPGAAILFATMSVGLLGYGISLVLFVLALRGLGTARTGAYFSTAPFIGAAVSLVVLGESTSAAFWFAAALMGWGVWLHLTEHHEHEHVHEPMEHSHRHVHDEHHRHEHDFDWQGDEPHEHRHSHAALTHKHPHFPDIHHRHSHPHAARPAL